jgi:hypothetical protein
VQDKNGRVWYFGEDSTEIEDGEAVGSVGSWEAGVQDAQPGSMMPARPRVGDSFRVEYAPGIVEEIAVIVARNVTVTVPYGTFESCLQVLEWDPLRGNRELKYYAPGIGLVLETLSDGSERLELVDVIR